LNLKVVIRSAMMFPFLAVLVLGCTGRGNMLAPGGLEPGDSPLSRRPTAIELPNIPDLGGVYDLTAQITSFDPAWGDLQGYHYAAVLTLQKQPDPTRIAGSYEDLRLMGPKGDSVPVAAAGYVTSSIDDRGRVVIELLGDGSHIGLTLIVATPERGFIGGGFGCCGHISGTFGVERR
jgi:hypothetical protein